MAPIIVVSNREPYEHRRTPDGTITCGPTTGGVAVALDALMRERGGTWIAHGAGDADPDVVDETDCIMVPPDGAVYRLRRIWLTAEEERRYYGGFSNEGLWPLCHIAHVKPIFRSEDWAAYQSVNDRFAEAIASELTDISTPVFIQDYHLALVAGALRRRRPDARTALFWHIPWPNPDMLRLCPWRRQVLDGLLANDLLAFQVERDRRNFLAAVREELGASVELGAVRHGGRIAHVVAAPIGVDFDRITRIARDPSLPAEIERLRAELQIDRPIVGVGVDRLDYTKGIPERLNAIDRLLSARPDLRERLLFIQVGVPSRSKLESYAAIEREIDRKVADINARHGRGPADGPVRYRKNALKMRRLVALYRLADFCVVSSLHDGMNLVAKEFVASRDDEGGVLVLSELTGAAQELGDAEIINPYDAEGFSAAIARAIEMTPEIRRVRMRRLRRAVAGHNVFVWASEILTNLDRLTATRVGFTYRPERRQRARGPKGWMEHAADLARVPSN